MRLVPLLLVPLVLAACSESGDDDRTASGQVLDGTIDDSMLPLETVRSQPPLAKETGNRGEGGAAPDAEATDGAVEDEAGEGDAAVDEAAPAEDDAG
jgi:hypothetical protein